MWRRTVVHPGILFGRDVRSIVPSTYFRTVEIDRKHQGKILASLFREGMVFRPHSDCATGAERIKRFVNVYLQVIVSNLKQISNMSTLPPLEKFLRTPMSMMPPDAKAKSELF